MVKIREDIVDWFGVETSEEELCGEGELVANVEGEVVAEIEETLLIVEDMGRGKEK